MNFTWNGIIIGLILVSIGTYFIYDAYRLNHQVVFLGWVERRWGPGAGTLAYKVIGMVLIVFAFFIATGLFNPFANPLDTMNARSGNSGGTQYYITPSSNNGVQLSN